MSNGTRLLAWPVCLATICVAVLATRVYVDFERVRIRVVTAPTAPEATSLAIPLRNQDQLAGLPVALILRLRGATQAVPVTVSLDGRPIAETTAPADDEVRVDTSIDVFPADAKAITVSGTNANWSLTYLETATVHGYAGPPLNLVIAPRARQSDAVLPLWALILVLAGLIAVRPRFDWPAGRVRYVYRALVGVVLLLFAVALLARVFTGYTVLLSVESFVLGAVILYAEPLSRIWMALKQRFFPGPFLVPQPPPLPGWREILVASVGLTAVIAVTLHVQVRNLGRVPDLGDPLFSMWRISWVVHQLVADPSHLFDANIFYPASGTLTYSDSIILPAIMAWPLLSIGLHPVVAYNLLFLSAFVLSGIATYVLARSFGWGAVAAWTSAIIFALYPFRIDHYSHLELQMAQWMPLAMLGIHRIMLGGGWQYGAVAAFAIGAQWYSSMYYALFLSVYLAAFALVLAMAWRRWPQLATAAVAVLIGGALAFPLAVAYSRAQQDRGSRPLDTVANLSATPADYLQPTARSALYAGMNPRPSQSERQLFPGVVPIALGITGLWPPLDITRVALLVGGAVAFDGSLGMNGFTYPWLYEYLYPFQSIRVPARFAILVGLTLALLSGAGVNRWLAATGHWRRSTAAVLLTLAAAGDAWPSLVLVPVWREPPAIYGQLGASSGAVLMEYPLNPDPAAFPENIPYLYFSTWHLTPMVNGYSGFTSPGYEKLAKEMRDFPRGDTLRVLEQAGVTHISVNCALDGSFGPYGVPEGNPERCGGTIRQLDADPRLRRVVSTTWEGAAALLYELRQ